MWLGVWEKQSITGKRDDEACRKMNLWDLLLVHVYMVLVGLEVFACFILMYYILKFVCQKYGSIEAIAVAPIACITLLCLFFLPEPYRSHLLTIFFFPLVLLSVSGLVMFIEKLCQRLGKGF